MNKIAYCVLIILENDTALCFMIYRVSSAEPIHKMYAIDAYLCVEMCYEGYYISLQAPCGDPLLLTRLNL